MSIHHSGRGSDCSGRWCSILLQRQRSSTAGSSSPPWSVPRIRRTIFGLLFPSLVSVLSLGRGPTVGCLQRLSHAICGKHHRVRGRVASPSQQIILSDISHNKNSEHENIIKLNYIVTAFHLIYFRMLWYSVFSITGDSSITRDNQAIKLSKFTVTPVLMQ